MKIDFSQANGFSVLASLGSAALVIASVVIYAGGLAGDLDTKGQLLKQRVDRLDVESVSLRARGDADHALLVEIRADQRALRAIIERLERFARAPLPRPPPAAETDR